MNADPFDAVITIGDNHLEAAGLTGRADEAVAAVRSAIERMNGAGWIDVEAQSYPPKLAGWVVVYPPGRCSTPETPGWYERRRQVEAAATAALLGAVLGHWAPQPQPAPCCYPVGGPTHPLNSFPLLRRLMPIDNTPT